MTDIVKRLTEWRDATNVRMEVRELARDALAEIERLSTEIAHLQARPTIPILNERPKG